MSALPARRVAGQPRPAPQASARLRVVPAPSPTRTFIPYLLLCAAILAASLVAALVLNTQMTVAAHEIRDLERTLKVERETESSLRLQVEAAASPSALEERATELGMVPLDEVSFIDLATGEIRRLAE